MKKVICEGNALPEWYGAAYSDDYGRLVTCYPIPINLIVGAYKWARRLIKSWSLCARIIELDRENYELMAEISSLEQMRSQLVERWKDLDARLDARDAVYPI